ncbi:F-box protein SKIP23-like [Arachis hypogaea]|uniref:F-box protein SKIP23-like n=2 Tax=Arachis TaxID=3817 RepID=UPI003B21A71B
MFLLYFCVVFFLSFILDFYFLIIACTSDMGDTDGWAHIDEDLLLEISTRFFSYDDYIQLGLVCKEWRLKLPKIPNANNVPWLLIPEETEKNSYEDEEIYHLMQLPVAGQEILDTHGLKERGIYHVMLPNMQMQNYVIRGSSHGWLIMVSLSEGTVLLLNPFTNVEFRLPHISTFPNVIKYEPDNHGDEYTLLDFRDRSETFDCDFTHKIQLLKVVINSPPDCNNHNFMAAAIYGFQRRLAFYKSNDMRWVEFPTRNTEFEDVIFFGEKIYAVNHAGQLYEFDTNTKSGRLEGGIHEVRPPSRVDTSTLTIKYLIGCANGSLLMLVRHFRTRLNRRRYDETYKFDIYELKKNGKKWSRVYNLGDYILMIGFTSSVQIPASYPKTGNQIFFSDNMIEKSIDHVVAQDLGVFSLENRRFYRLLLDVKFFCSPLWLLP